MANVLITPSLHVQWFIAPHAIYNQFVCFSRASAPDASATELCRYYLLTLCLSSLDPCGNKCDEKCSRTNTLQRINEGFLLHLEGRVLFISGRGVGGLPGGCLLPSGSSTTSTRVGETCSCSRVPSTTFPTTRV